MAVLTPRGLKSVQGGLGETAERQYRSSLQFAEPEGANAGELFER
jgi:hypothetical protein